MIVLWIFLSFLALILLLLLLPVTVFFSFDQSLFLRVRYCGIPVYTYKPDKPEKKKNKPKSKPDEPSKKQEAPKKKNLFTHWREKHGFSGAVERAAGAVKIILRRTAWFVRRMKLRKLRLCIRAATGDAAQTAIEYGRICTAVYPVLTFLFTLLNCRAKSIDISADFHAENPKAALSLVVHARLLYALCTCLIGLWEYYRYKDVELHERK